MRGVDGSFNEYRAEERSRVTPRAPAFGHLKVLPCRLKLKKRRTEMLLKVTTLLYTLVLL